MKVMKYILAAAFVLALGFIGWNFILKPEAASKPYRDYQTIVAYGDSLIVGVGSTEGNDFVSQLSQKLGKNIINEGKSGETSSQGLARIDSILEHKPDMVLVLFGGNDALHRVDKAITFENLKNIISTLQKNNAEVVLLGIQGGAIGDPYKKEFETLAKDFDLVYVSNVLDDLFADKRYMADSVHPNDTGYAHISDRVYTALRPLFRR
jgi:lysophospholipase L1-like esterase